MAFAYYAAVAVALFLFFHRLLSDFRRAILIGVVFTTFALGGLPWHLVPFDAAAFACQVGFLSLTFTWFLMRRNKESAIRLVANHYLLGLFVLELILLAYLLISQSSGYGATLVVWLLVKSILPILALGFLAPFDSTDIRLIASVILVGAILTAIRLFAMNVGASSTEAFERLTLGADASPINVARVIGLGATMLIVRILRGSDRVMGMAARVPLLAFLLYAVALTGSRGPLMAPILVVPATFVFLGHGSGIRRRMVVTWALAFALLAGIALLLPGKVFEQTGIQRVLAYTDSIGNNANDRVRLELLEAAWDGFIASSGLGVGTGGFEALYGVPGHRYPHNLVLEVAVNYGWVGLGLLLLLLAGTVRRIVRLSNQHNLDINIPPLLALWFYALFNAMVSMDIAGNYTLWVSGGLVWLLSPAAVPGTSRAARVSEMGRSG